MMYWTPRKPADFAEILAELDRAQAPESVEPPTRDGTMPSSEMAPGAPAQSRNRLGQVLSSFAWRRFRDSRVARAEAAAAYAEEAGAPQSRQEPSPVPQALPPRPTKTENEVIAEELGLMRPLATDELRQLRRDFAKRNHPDRCAPAQRPRAARRMSIANMLIDAALKQTQR
jgi:hypothetical protein